MKKISKQQLVNIIREVLSDDTLKLPGLYRKQSTPTKKEPALARGQTPTKKEPALARTRKTEKELEPLTRTQKTEKELEPLTKTQKSQRLNRPVDRTKGKRRRYNPEGIFGPIEPEDIAKVHAQLDADIDNPFQYYLDLHGPEAAIDLFMRHPGQKIGDEENPAQAAARDAKFADLRMPGETQPKKSTLSEMVRQEIKNFLKNKA